MKTKSSATLFAVLAAALYAINVPISKILLEYVNATMMAALLYLGAGVGMLIYGLVQRNLKTERPQEQLTKKELLYTVAMVVLDIMAPIMLMLGISATNSANVSLLNNFEIVATSLIALQYTNVHEHTHTHEHSHGSLIHTHRHSHIHVHYGILTHISMKRLKAPITCIWRISLIWSVRRNL